MKGTANIANVAVGKEERRGGTGMGRTFYKEKLSICVSSEWIGLDSELLSAFYLSGLDSELHTTVCNTRNEEATQEVGGS